MRVCNDPVGWRQFKKKKKNYMKPPLYCSFFKANLTALKPSSYSIAYEILLWSLPTTTLNLSCCFNEPFLILLWILPSNTLEPISSHHEYLILHWNLPTQELNQFDLSLLPIRSCNETYDNKSFLNLTWSCTEVRFAVYLGLQYEGPWGEGSLDPV